MIDKTMPGGKVRGLRQRLGLTQVEMAERLGISASYLNLIEHGQRVLTLNLLLRLRAFSGILYDNPSLPPSRRDDFLRVVIRESERRLINELLDLAKVEAGRYDWRVEKAVVFEKFRQGGSTLSAKPQGTGLGFGISRRIVEHFGGRIWVESESGRRSTSVFTLLLAAKAAPEQAAQ